MRVRKVISRVQFYKKETVINTQSRIEIGTWWITPTRNLNRFQYQEQQKVGMIAQDKADGGIEDNDDEVGSG